MAYTTREFIETQILTLDELLDLQYAQLQGKKRVLDQIDDNQFSQSLSGVTGILSLLFALSTGYSVSLAVASVLTSLTTNERTVLSDTITTGYVGLGEPIELMRNSTYDQIEIEFPFIEYTAWSTGEKVRFLSAEGLAKRVHTDSGWIVF